MKPPAKTVIETTAGILDELRRLGISAKGIQSDSRRLLRARYSPPCQASAAMGVNHIRRLSRGACAILWESESLASLLRRWGNPNIPVRGLINLTGELGHEIAAAPRNTSRSAASREPTENLGQPVDCPGDEPGRSALRRDRHTGQRHLRQERQPGENTTPDALTLQSTLAKIRDDGAKFCAMKSPPSALTRAGQCRSFRYRRLHQPHARPPGISRRHASVCGSQGPAFELPGIRTAVLNLDDPLGVALAGHLAGKAYSASATPWTKATPRSQRRQMSQCPSPVD